MVNHAVDDGTVRSMVCRRASPAERRRLRVHYRCTRYRVYFASGPVDIRIGVPEPRLDTLLSRSGHRHWAFLTAFNPASSRLPARENERRQRRLLRVLRAHGAVLFPGLGIADAGDWPPERSVLAFGPTATEALALAASFGQYAIVCGRRGGAARLRWS